GIRDFHVTGVQTCALPICGESEQRLYLLSAWREATVYSERERAALAWTEAVTRLEHQEVPDDVYELARAEFTEDELVSLTLAIVAINAWNRLSIAFKRPADDYEPGSVHRIAAAHGS